MTLHLIKWVLCCGILLLVYHFFLEKEKIHRFNRWYLLLSLLFSFITPLIQIEAKEEITPLAEIPYLITSNIVTGSEDKGPSQQITTENQSANSSTYLLSTLYCVITSLLVLRFIKNIYLLRKKIKRGKRITYRGASIIICESAIAPHSFLNYIFLNEKEYYNNEIEKEILQHELAHVNQKHSLDVLFIEFLLSIAWFNPFLLSYRKAISLNHEFLADASALKFAPDIKAYQHLLLNKATSSSHLLLSSSFNYITMKKRLIMITKKTSLSTNVSKKLVLIPFAILLVFLFSEKITAQDNARPLPREEKIGQIYNDTTKQKFTIIGINLGYTREGASEELLNEYNDILKKYKINDTIGVITAMLSPADKARLETIYKQMSLEQQGNLNVRFIAGHRPLSKTTPTAEQFNNFKNSKVYGVWVNEKKISNKSLNSYKNTDFSQVFVSKLYANARKGKTYTHQVNLMTNEYYKAYYQKAIADTASIAYVVNGNFVISR